MAKIFDLEQKVADQLALLKNEFGLHAVKAEFEAEGASFRDLLRIRRLTVEQNISLYLKIGGVEALRDLKDALDLGVDGIIAPMVESAFGVVKFTEAVESIFSRQKLFKSINIETKESVEKIDLIMKIAKHKVDNITIGRTDLGRSYFDTAIYPDSEFIFNLIESIGCKIQTNGFTLTVGGGVNKETIRLFRQRKKELEKVVSNIETRKVIFPFKQMLEGKDALKEALYFEELFLLYKLECEKWSSRADLTRLGELKNRL